jgi:hypothetical protein
MAEPSEPGIIVQTLPAGAGVPNSTNNDCPVWLTSDGSRRACALLKQQKDTGIIIVDGKRRHDAPGACDMPYPEGTYAKPENAVLVTHAFVFNNKKKDENSLEQNLRTARQELHDIGLSGKINEQQVEDHLLLMEDVYIQVAKVYKSKFERHYAMEVKHAKIPKGQNETEHCITSTDAWLALGILGPQRKNVKRCIASSMIWMIINGMRSTMKL